MFTHDPLRKIRAAQRLSVLRADGESASTERFVVRPVIAEVERKIKPRAPAAHGRPVSAVSLIRASVPCQGRFNEMPCLLTLRSNLQHQEQTGSCRTWLLSGKRKWSRIKPRCRRVYCLAGERKPLIVDGVFLNLNFPCLMNQLCNILIINFTSTALIRASEPNEREKTGCLKIRLHDGNLFSLQVDACGVWRDAIGSVMKDADS